MPTEGTEVVNALMEIIANDPPTASAIEVGRRLVHCQRCERFRNGRCGKYSWRDWLARLTEPEEATVRTSCTCT